MTSSRPAGPAVCDHCRCEQGHGEAFFQEVVRPVGPLAKRIDGTLNKPFTRVLCADCAVLFGAVDRERRDAERLAHREANIAKALKRPLKTKRAS